MYYSRVVVTVRVPEALRRFCGGKGMVPAEGGTVRAALEAAFAGHPELRARVLDGGGRLHPYLLLYADGQPASLETPLTPGAMLEIVAAAEGG